MMKSSSGAATLAGAFRRMAVPLTAYYAVTLAIPIANGAAQSGPAFMKHAAVVMITPPIIIALSFAVVAAVHWIRDLRGASRASKGSCR